MKTRTQKVEEFLNSLSIDIDFSQIDAENVNSYDELRDELEDNNLLDVEIIYYRRAMEYLTENDCSLNESMKIAQEYGYEPKNINSELLASLLASRNLRDEFYELENEITDFFDELEDDEEETEEDEDTDEEETI